MSRLFSFLTGAAALTLVSAHLGGDHVLTAPPAHHTHAKRQSSAAAAATSPLPLTEYHYAYTDIPYQVNPYPVGRGPQAGYNLCNSTTEGAASQCQTLIVNSLADFCLWGAPGSGQTIGDIEAAVVAYCTQNGHGARLIPSGKITGAQFMKTSAYIQITGHIDLTGLGLTADDTGGELDPHGADLLGNPLGGLVYSSGMPSGDNKTYDQVIEWNNFVGSGTFCIKLCDPTVKSPNYCENRYDLIGCSYNMPASYKDGEFTSCEGDLQDVVGVYTSDGQVYTWSQPDPLPATSTLPWTPRIPASSNCVTHQSSELFPAASTTASGSASTSASGSQASVTGTKSGSSASGSGSSATRSGSSASASATDSNGAGHLVASTGALAVVAGAVVALF